jgi:ATP-dependent Zn protease
MTQPFDFPPYRGNVPPRRIGKGIFGWIVFIGLAAMLVALMYGHSAGAQRTIPLSEFRTQMASHNVQEITIDGDEITGVMKNPGGDKVGFRTEVPTGTSSNWAFTQWMLDQSSATITVKNTSSVLSNLILPLVPWVLIFGFIWFFVFRRLRKLKQGFSGVRLG